MALKRDTQVLVIGAGPVGLFSALSLAERGLSVEVVDKEWRGSVHSYALALHPQSLDLLDRYGAANELIEQGHRIEQVAIYVGDDRVGALDLSSLGGAFPFLLVVPQSALESALEQRLKQKKIKVFWNHQALSLKQEDGAVNAKIARLEKYSMGYPVARTEWMIAKETQVRAAFVVGADGYHSFVRKAIGSQFEHRGQAEAFAVFEFPSRIEFQHEARVEFHEGTTNVVWPLDPQRGRWSFQVDKDSPPQTGVDTLQQMIRARAPWFQPKIEEVYWTTTALFERRLVDRFGRGRIWLAGDAAHITGPVGVQSMNVGIREAHDLAERIAAILESGGAADGLEGYETERQAEWRKLLGVEGGATPAEDAPGWAGELATKILPCTPASGEDLVSLLSQIGLKLT